MRLPRRLKLIAGAAIVALVGVLCWAMIQRYQHRIVIVFPDGVAASGATITLDYDPVYSYHPTVITGNQRGIVFIPPGRAHGAGWEVMRISARNGDLWYHAKRDPDECQYPMKVVLEEHSPIREPNAIEQAAQVWEVLKHATSPQR